MSRAPSREDRRRPALAGYLVDPLADDVGPRLLVDRVVHVNQVRVGDAAGRDGCRDHLGGAVTAGVSQNDRDRPAQHHIDATPDSTAGGVVVDMFFELIAANQDLARFRAACRQYGVGHRVRGLIRVSHPPSPQHPPISSFKVPCHSVDRAGSIAVIAATEPPQPVIGHGMSS